MPELAFGESFGMSNKKPKDLVVSKKHIKVPVGLLITLFLAYAAMVYPLEGVYHGLILRSVSGGDMKLVLKKRRVYLQTPSHPIVLAG